MGSEKNIKEVFLKELANSALRRRIALAGGLLSVLSSVVFLLLFLLLALNSLFSNWSFFPFFAFLFFWTGVACALLYSLLSPSFHVADKSGLAALLDGKTGGYRSLFGSALEFSREEKGSGGYSRYLIDEAIRRANIDIKKLKEKNIFAAEGRSGWAAAGILLGVLFVCQALFAPQSVNEIISFISDPGVSFTGSEKANILAASGNISLLEGEDIYVEGINFGAEAKDVTLCTSSVDGVWKEEKIAPDTVSAGNIPFAVYRKTLKSPQDDLIYCFKSDGGSSDTFGVDVTYFPVINRLSARLDYPDYTRMPSETVETVAGRMRVPLGTSINISGKTSKIIKEGTLMFTRAKDLPVKVSGDKFSASFTAGAKDTFHVSVTDSEGHENKHRIFHPLEVTYDLPPEVEVITPEDGALLPRSLLASLQYRAVDDYSVSRINLKFKIEEKEYKTIVLFKAEGKNNGVVKEVFEWSLEGNSVMPGDRIYYYLEAFDSNVLSGPGYSRTELRYMDVPSLSQMYASHRKSQERQTNQIDDLYRSGQEAKEKLKKLSDRFKAEPEMDWGKKREGKNVLEKFKKLRQKALESASRMEKSLNLLQQNRMTSMKIGKKLERIQQLISRLESETLKDLIEKTNRIMNELSEEDITSAMEDLEISTEEMTEELDRTIDYLKQVMREEKMEELMRRMESMLERQKALRDSAEAEDLEKLSEDQKDLAKEAKEYEEDLGSLSKSEDNKRNSELERAHKQLEEAKLDSVMNKAAGQMESGERNGARCTQKDAVDEMLGLYTSLGRCQKGMSMRLSDRVKKSIQHAADMLVETSKLQEEVAKDLAGAGSPAEGTASEKQMFVEAAIRDIVEELYEITRKSMFRSRLVFTHLGCAARGAEGVLDAIENRRHGKARDSSRYALGHLNKGVIELLRANSSSNGGGGGAKKKISDMLNRQMAIDRQLQKMYGNQNRSSLSMSQRAKMSRLAAKQRKMKEIAEQIEEESVGGEDLLGEIEGLASQMDSIAEKLDEGKLDKDLIGMEERVLGRMLQAQRSINRRDYKRERVSRNAEILWGDDPGRAARTSENSDAILEMIRSGMRMKGPREYEDLIDLYFRALSRKVRERGE
ncbi:MAG: DUF4175 family protein [Candidatus Krumholzibacteriota bacterium]|nr:DUF4175 family protein [Candidatus Krumholzibacteriota bacterium]